MGYTGICKVVSYKGVSHNRDLSRQVTTLIQRALHRISSELAQRPVAGFKLFYIFIILSFGVVRLPADSEPVACQIDSRCTIIMSVSVEHPKNNHGMRYFHMHCNQHSTFITSTSVLHVQRY